VSGPNGAVCSALSAVVRGHQVDQVAIDDVLSAFTRAVPGVLFGIHHEKATVLQSASHVS